PRGNRPVPDHHRRTERAPQDAQAKRRSLFSAAAPMATRTGRALTGKMRRFRPFEGRRLAGSNRPDADLHDSDKDRERWDGTLPFVRAPLNTKRSGHCSDNPAVSSPDSRWSPRRHGKALRLQRIILLRKRAPSRTGPLPERFNIRDNPY